MYTYSWCYITERFFWGILRVDVKNKNVKNNIISIILVLIILACLVYLGRYFYQQYQSKKLYEQMQEELMKKPPDGPSATPTLSPTPTAKPVVPTAVPEVSPTPTLSPTPTPVEIPVDFEALWDINDHAYAWIEIPGTDISYPILQHPKENAYYLERTIDGKQGLPGAIYTHGLCNNRSFQDFNTVIYGHNMRVETMFGKLKYYREEDFFKEHDTVVIYLPEKRFTYKVVAAVEHSDRHLSYEYKFKNEQGRQAFIDDIMSATKGTVDKDAVLTTEDKYITLSTCISDQPTKRFLVVAVLIEEKDGVIAK